MPLHLQTRFLRVLQERQINRLGSVVSHHLDIRVIAATHADLEELVRNGSFRADLYYRLNILRVYTPSLKERKEDILYLANSFLEKYRKTLNDLPSILQKAFYTILGRVISANLKISLKESMCYYSLIMKF